MKFSEGQTHKVTLHHHTEGDLGEAELRFGGKLGLVAAGGMLSKVSKMDPKKLVDFVVATGGAYTFTLCDCRVYGGSLYPKFLVYGNISETRFSRIEIQLSEISEWFLRWERVEGEVGKQLSWTIRTDHFSADVTEGTRQFKISSNYDGDHERVGEDRIVHERVVFSFGAASNLFSLEDIREKALDLYTVLSVLIAYPISIVSINIFTKAGDGHAFYFLSVEQRPRDWSGDFWLQCFLRKEVLDGRWPAILERYYQDHERRDLWRRLVGMWRYEGYWEYKLVGFVSLLDRYVDLRTRAHPIIKASPGARLKKFKKDLYKVLGSQNSNQFSAISELATDTFGDSAPSFGDRFKKAMSDTDKEIVAIIGLEHKGFELIKKVRDAVAHGSPPEVTDRDFPGIEIIIGKISLLLTYWAQLDLGISKEQFLGGMKTHNFVYMRAIVDRVALARATRSAPFYKVSPDEFERLTGRKELRFDACFIEGPDREISLSEEYTKSWKTWSRDPKRTGSSTEWLTSVGLEQGSAKFPTTVYLESGSKTREFGWICIIDKSKLPPESTTASDGAPIVVHRKRAKRKRKT
jgi:hypothetical protein